MVSPQRDTGAVPVPGRRLPGGIGGAGQHEPETALVVGFDHDEASRAALAAAVDLGSRLRAHLQVVHVITLGDFPVDPDGPDWEERGARTLDEEREHVRRAVSGHGFGWAYQAWHGNPATILAAVADLHDALMIIVGRHQGGIPEVLHRVTGGSVSRRLPGMCGRPVLLVPVASSADVPGGPGGHRGSRPV